MNLASLAVKFFRNYVKVINVRKRMRIGQVIEIQWIAGAHYDIIAMHGAATTGASGTQLRQYITLAVELIPPSSISSQPISFLPFE